MADTLKNSLRDYPMLANPALDDAPADDQQPLATIRQQDPPPGQLQPIRQQSAPPAPLPRFQRNPFRQQQEQGLQQSLLPKPSPSGFWGKTKGILEDIGNTAGTIFLGNNVMSGIPGSAQNNALKQGSAIRQLTDYEDQDRQDQQAFDKTQREQQQQPLVEAQTREANARASSLENPMPAPKEEAWEIAKDYTGPNGEPVEVEKNSGQMRLAGQTGPAFKRVAASPKENTPQQQAYDSYIAAGMTPQQAYEKIRERPPVINPNANSARSDKSYQYNQGELDKLTTPISALVSRMGRLNDTLAQGSPQADALVAPELMTVMAGGQGSGLRINEAEINRVLGGRSHWEDLKAAAQKWSLDPKSANSITTDQRQQIHALVKLVNDKVLMKQKALDEAANGLVDTDDPKEHRRIVQRARQALTGVDEGSANAAQGPQGTEMVRARDPQGNLHEAPKGTALPKGWTPQ